MHALRTVVVAAVVVACSALALARNPAGGPVQDAVKVSPHMYKVLLENEHVRVLEFRAKAGEKEPTHSHPGMVVHVLSDGRVRTTPSGGTPEELQDKPGTTIWVPPLTHTFEVLGPGEAHSLIVEVKAATSEQPRTDRQTMAADDDPAGIRAAIGAYEKALNAGDVEAMVATFRPDAVLLPPGAPAREGADAIREHLRELIGIYAFDLTFVPDDVVSFGGWGMARAAIGGTRTLRSGTVQRNDNKALFVMRREADGTWRIARYQYNTDGPLQAGSD